jgi:hypothetical protein
MRYGGNSRINEEGVPRKSVIDSNFDTSIVIATENVIITVKINADTNESDTELTDPMKNADIKVISNGKRPLHGTKLLVSIAISLSLGELIILHPVTPTALQPNPMHMVNACFPQVLHF